FSTFAVKILPDSILAPWEWTLLFSIGTSLLILFRSIPEIERKASIYRLMEEQKYCAPEDVWRVFANRLPEGGEYMEESLSYEFEKKGGSSLKAPTTKSKRVKERVSGTARP
ncbi:MAG: hypothetical protein JW839_17895, partial [Candidatus Lokiarchaeota archaeon]|nr:hypothetical protein [Candidatus Lokiarchaeota archaeon]